MGSVLGTGCGLKGLPIHIMTTGSCFFNDLHGLESIWIATHNDGMRWPVRFHPSFEREFDLLNTKVQDELLAQAHLLEGFGPRLGRPRVDTLNGSTYANMKELRFEAADGVWRVAFAFDPSRQAMLLVAGDKSGTSEKRFYKRLISKADERFGSYLAGLRGRKQT